MFLMLKTMQEFNVRGETYTVLILKSKQRTLSGSSTETVIYTLSRTNPPVLKQRSTVWQKWT